MLKEVKICVLHDGINSIEEFISMFNLKELESEYVLIWDAKNPDVLVVTDHIYSRFNKFKKEFKKINSKIKVFFASEALYPDFNIFDYAIGWDGHINYDRYCQLPPTFDYPSRLFINERVNSITTKEEAVDELAKKTGFCSFLYSNWKAHPMRDNVFYAVSQYKKVDSLGKHLNNVKTSGTGYVGHRKDGIAIKSAYKFSISCENAEHSGYTTEKILTSFNAHSIPIYWGDPDINDRFNPEAFINVSSFDSQEDLVKEIKRIDNDNELWCKMISAPWQTEEQISNDKKRLSDYLSFWKNIFDNLEHSRIPKGTMASAYEYWFFKRPWSKFHSLMETFAHKIRTCSK